MSILVDGRPDKAAFTLFTRVDGNAYSYSIGRDTGIFLPADGKTRTVKINNQTVQASVRCSGEGTFEREIVFESGVKSWLKVTPLGSDHLTIENSNPAGNGVYERDKR